MTHEYTVVIEPCEGEPGFVATVPALPGCVTQGDTLDEALANVRDANGAPNLTVDGDSWEGRSIVAVVELRAKQALVAQRPL